MIQIVNGLEKSLAKQYFDDWLVSIKQQDCCFSRSERKIKNKWRASQLLEAVIYSKPNQIATFWMIDFGNTNFKIYFGR